ncbi:MAG: hypothetical protein Q7T07_05125 [Burkholderiaceae bacterium]|nr:hypothetical protein [Burkholderiaceae bacterium]
MATKFIIATLISIASLGVSAAFATEYDAKTEPEKLIKSTAPRAAVKADTRKAVKEKTLPATGEAGPKVVIDKNSDHSRADEKAEARKANKAGKLPVATEAGVKEVK